MCHGTKRLIAGVFLLAVLALAVVTAWHSSTPRKRVEITQENCDKIQPGMSEREVEAILGGPAGDYVEEPRSVTSRKVLKQPDTHYTKEWDTDEAYLYVHFNKDGRVLYAGILCYQRVSPSQEPSLMERIGIFFGWK